MTRQIHTGLTGCTARAAGFTLLELLLAVAIFALLGIASHRLLHSATVVQQAVAEQRELHLQAQRLLQQLRYDLVNAVDSAPQFVGEPTQLRWTTRLAERANQWPLWQLTAVTYRFTPAPTSGLQRAPSTTASSDKASQLLPTEPGALIAASSGQFRYRDADQQWHSHWPPLQSSSSTSLPVAVELTLRDSLLGSLTQTFSVASAALATEPQ